MYSQKIVCGVGGGVPHLADRGEGSTPILPDRGCDPILLMGVPPSGQWGVPHVTDGGTPPIRRQSSRASTCYTAGGMPLAFTQENFLVFTLCF